MHKLSRENIQANLGPLKQKIAIELPEVVSSTNDVAKQGLQKQPNKMTLVATNKQTAGKGRSGKAFYSNLAHGLYFTLGFQPNTDKIEETPLYTILAAAALVEVLRPELEEPLAIKWVNDIFYKGRKVAGILSEMTFDGVESTAPGIVVGIGLNFAGDFSETAENIQTVAGTLFGKETPETFNQNDFLSAFIQKFNDYHENFQARDFMAIYEKHLLGIGKEITYTVKEKEYRGVIQGINESGHLLVLKPDQTIETLYGQAVHFGSKQFIE
jgi:BirA family biotin operon repressor/biotin-[acetyl-CoA-carboxylase] ligase